MCVRNTKFVKSAPNVAERSKTDARGTIKMAMIVVRFWFHSRFFFNSDFLYKFQLSWFSGPWHLHTHQGLSCGPCQWINGRLVTIYSHAALLQVVLMMYASVCACLCALVWRYNNGCCVVHCFRGYSFKIISHLIQINESKLFFVCRKGPQLIPQPCLKHTTTIMSLKPLAVDETLRELKNVSSERFQTLAVGNGQLLPIEECF